MKIDHRVISILDDNIEANVMIKKSLIENNIPHSIGATYIYRTETNNYTTIEIIKFFTLYKFNCEDDAVEFKLKYM